jgi:hypothetical protein
MKKLIVIILLFVAGYVKAQQPGVVVSDKAGWHKIGETTVEFKQEKDEISVMGADRFAAVKIKVTESPVNITSFDIYFENGEVQSVPIGAEIKAAGESKTVELKGGERAIKKVVFVYKTGTDNMDKKAHVELWGMKNNTVK